MEEYLNEHFLPIYKRNVSKIEIPIPTTKLQKRVEGLLHQKAFELWLGKKYPAVKKIEEYFEFYTDENFQEFIVDFNKVKNSIENHDKRKKIKYDILEAEKYPLIKMEAYDIDIVGTYYKIEKLLESVVLNKGVDKEQYLEVMKHPIVSHCKKNKLSFEYVFHSKYPIIVYSTFDRFYEYMGRDLIAYDENKIEAFLDSHKASWLGDGFYPTIIEHGVYNYVKNNSPFDNSIRLKAITNWVKENRAFVFVDNENKAVYKKGKEPIIISTHTDKLLDDKKDVKQALIKKKKEPLKIRPLTWSPEVDKKYLKQLSKELKSKGYTKMPTDFEKVFTVQKRISWLKDAEFLAYLLFRLYNEHKAIKAHKRGYFKAAQILIYDSKDTVVKKFADDSLKDLNHNITVRSPEKHLKLRNKVNYILKEIFQK